MEIFKIQLPITSNEPNPPALIYNESREFEIQIDVCLVEYLFRKGEKKIYIYGEIKNGSFSYKDRIKRAPDQDW